MPEPILLASHPVPNGPAVECLLRPEMANRHGLITGATGTGKTVTLQKLAAGFSRMAVPVFLPGGDNPSPLPADYGNVSAASIGAIQRGLLQIDSQGGDKFFGEPMLDIADLMQTVDGQGVVNILAADRLMTSPRLYATFLLWL